MSGAVEVPAGAAMRLLVELRAALAAGVAPAQALRAAVARHPDALPGLEPATRRIALGAGLAGCADDLGPRHAHAALLLRGLALAESVGVGGVEAVDQVEGVLREEAELARRLRVRTAQARATLRVLAAVPVAALGLLLIAEPRALAYFATAAGRVTALIGLVLSVGARAWARRIVRRVPRAAAAADPLGLLAGGAAEVAELAALALAGGHAPAAVPPVLLPHAPPAARACLERAARALAAGMPLERALADGPLRGIGEALAAAERWGASGTHALRAYAASLRAERRAALEEAAERAEVRLVFPTTLLALPSFLVVVAPPLVWAALTGG